MAAISSSPEEGQPSAPSLMALMPRSRACLEARATSLTGTALDDHFGAGGLDLGELGAEVHVAGLEGLVRHDGAAQLEEGLLEVVPQAHRVVGADLIEHGRLLRLQVLEGEVGQHGPLVRVDEADPEGVAGQLAGLRHGDLGVGGVGGDDRHVPGLGDGRHGHVAAAGVAADDGHHVVLVDQALDGVDRLQLVALVVVGDDLHLPAQDAAGLLIWSATIFQARRFRGGAQMAWSPEMCAEVSDLADGFRAIRARGRRWRERAPRCISWGSPREGDWHGQGIGGVQASACSIGPPWGWRVKGQATWRPAGPWAGPGGGGLPGCGRAGPAARSVRRRWGAAGCPPGSATRRGQPVAERTWSTVTPW